MPKKPLIAFPTQVAVPALAGVPLAELKQHLLVFVPTPPGPKTTAAVLEAYFELVGDRFVEYGSTAFGSVRYRWDASARKSFFAAQLPHLRGRRDWGYSFSDGKGRDSWMAMVHGFRPQTEPGQASLFRFEFDATLPPDTLAALAEQVLSLVECTCGTAGYMFQGIPRGPGGLDSWNKIFAWARRYWGVEVQDLEATSHHVLEAFKCVSWLTMIGPSVEAVAPDAVQNARELSGSTFSAINGNSLFRVGEAPVLGDRNRSEDLAAYEALAEALLPLQVVEHASFGDGYRSLWDEDTTKAWLRRFTAPTDFADL